MTGPELDGREVADVDALASQQFSDRHAAFILDLPREQRSAAFLRHWTLCEALLKATGKGLQASMPQLSFKSEIGAPVRAFNRFWHVHTILLYPGVVGAIAFSS